MASFLLPFSSVVEAIRRFFAAPPGRSDALYILEDMDRYRNLHTGVAVVSFFVSAALGVLAFFLMTESALWVGINKQVAMLVVSVSWVLIFPIWALIFLFIMSALGAVGIKDVRAVVRSRLSALALSQDQLRELQGLLASRTWRHGRVFKSAIADLTKEQVRP